MSDLLHWHEGLFLQPHHLQSLQRLVTRSASTALRMTWPYAYGVAAMRLSVDAINNHLIRFDELKAIMPSGLVLDYPNNTDIDALDIKRAFASSSDALTLRLGVPLYQPSRANAVDAQTQAAGYVKRLYRVGEVERLDENTGDNAQPMAVRRINAKLLINDEDDTDMETMTILRVGRFSAAEGSLPRVDPAFAPPCLVLDGSAALRDMMRDIVYQVDARRRELTANLTRGGFNLESLRGVQFEQMLRLRVLNRFAARLGPIMKVTQALAPFQAFLELRELAAELATLRPDRDSSEFPDYDHDRPMLCFAELIDRIRGMLANATPGRVLEVKFERKDNLYVADLTPEHLTAPNEYFLSIRTKIDSSELGKLVEDRDAFKFMAYSMANQRVWGVRLAQERNPPVTLRAETGLHYFRLLRGDSARMWEQIAGERRIACRWPDADLADFVLTLCMTVPQAAV